MQQIIEKCEGLRPLGDPRDLAASTARSYAQPAAKMGRKACNFATHVRAEVDTTRQGQGQPLKASKRAARGR
jgi:hypothetical protein